MSLEDVLTPDSLYWQKKLDKPLAGLCPAVVVGKQQYWPEVTTAHQKGAIKTSSLVTNDEQPFNERDVYRLALTRPLIGTSTASLFQFVPSQKP